MDEHGREIAVADEPSKNPGPFDVKTIEVLVALMSKHDISEMDLCNGDQRVRLRRGNRVLTSIPLAPMAGGPPSSLPAATPTAHAAPPADKPSRTLIDIRSPTIGTFYAQEKEGAKPYVTLGSRVTTATTVGLIEAMKLFSEIPAGCNGVITEILVENQKPVEWNQVLFRVDPSK
jgi:acetyl-CoA carboxylase biotin carboxyl carrier protein